MSVAAFDASQQLATTGHWLLSEAAVVSERAAAGRGAQGAGGHWSERTGRQRLAEVLARMKMGEAQRAGLGELAVPSGTA